MIHKVIRLSELHPLLKDSDAYLSVYVHSQVNEYNNCDYKRPSLLIVPGGGYEFVSFREQEDVAFRFCSEGFNCFCLVYTCYAKYPLPHLEAAVALHYINTHKKEFGLFEQNAFMIGFSAGGHLVGSFGYLYPELADILSFDKNLIKPQGLVLSYPVILMNELTHFGTKRVITDNDPSLIEKLSIEKHITKDYPPTFIWTTSTDDCVPPENTYVLIEEFKKHGVEFDQIIYPFGPHGASLSRNSTTMNYDLLTDEQEEISSWVGKASRFMLKQLQQ